MIEFSHVSKVYPNGVKAMDDVCLQIEQGEFVGIIGLSGGIDSCINAALLVKALGKDRVIGVLMPNGTQSDIDDAYGICNELGIKHFVINIKDAYDGAIKSIKESCELTNQAIINLAPRIRMSILYAVSQCNNGRVANTCNLSEDWVGYSTRYGDSVGDFAPTSCFTVAEMKMIGKELGISEKYYNKVTKVLLNTK